MNEPYRWSNGLPLACSPRLRKILGWNSGRIKPPIKVVFAAFPLSIWY